MRRTFASVLRVTQADAFTAKTKNGLRGPFYAMLKQGQTSSRADLERAASGTLRGLVILPHPDQGVGQSMLENLALAVL
jgi:hypothetical protein